MNMVDHRRPLIRGAAALLLAASMTAAGCGGAGPQRRAVSGEVTLDGKPLAAGTVTFAPREGVTAATAEVFDGSFRIGPSEGPAPGSYQVEIASVRPTGRRIKHPDLPSETIEEVHNVIPPQYNVETSLSADVQTEGQNSFRFDLVSRRRDGKTRTR